jgi:hypothetical protein
LVILLFVNAITFLLLTEEDFKNQWYNFFQINLFILNSFLFLLLISQKIIYHFLLLIFVFLYWFILKLINFRLNQLRLYNPELFKKVAFLLNTINFFCFTTHLNTSLYIFFNIYFVFTLIPHFLFSYWSFFYLIKINGLKFNKDALLVLSLILTEFYFVFYFLPIIFYFTNLLLTIIYAILFKIWWQKQKLMSLTVMKELKK